MNSDDFTLWNNPDVPRKLYFDDDLETMQLVFEAVLETKFKSTTALFGNQQLCLILHDLICFLIPHGQADYLIEYMQNFEIKLPQDTNVMNHIKGTLTQNKNDELGINRILYPLNRLKSNDFDFDITKYFGMDKSMAPPNYYLFIFNVLRSSLLCARLGEERTDLRFSLEDKITSYIEYIYSINIKTRQYSGSNVFDLMELKDLIFQADQKLTYHERAFKAWPEEKVQSNIYKMFKPYQELDETLVRRYEIWWERLQLTTD